MTLEEQIRAGERVEQFLNDEAVKAAFARVREKYVDEWTRADTTEAREACWHKHAALADVWAEIGAIPGNGKMAERTLEAERKSANAHKRKGQ